MTRLTTNLPTDDSLNVDRSEAFRGAMRRLAAGVVVVTTRIDGRPWGLTISACCSVSTEPPRLLVSLGRHTSTWHSIVAEGEFGVSLLSAEQVNVARFCSTPGQPKFIDEYAMAESTSRTPVLDGALAHLDCRLDVHQQVGDHELVVGQVANTLLPVPNEPLIYFDRSFRSLNDINDK